jgi:outer membrane protein TolC
MKNFKIIRINKGTLPLRQIKMAMIVAVLTMSGGCAVTPVAFSDAENMARVELDSQQIYASQEAVTGPIDVYDAMARALRYNLDKRVRLAELAVANYQVNVDLWDLVPPLDSRTGIQSRNKVNASSSRSIESGLESLEPSTSTENTVRAFDLRMAFNVLDFGVSYLRARQSGNQTLIAKERQRSTAQSIIRDVRSVYWNAVAAERVQDKIEPMVQGVQKALEAARQTVSQGLRTPLEALRYQLALVDAMEKLQRLRIQITAPRMELARIMNLRPDQDFTLLVPDRNRLTVPSLDTSVSTLETQALQSRPELRESAYLHRISADETRKTFVRLLPGIEIGGGYNLNSNDFLTNKNWSTYSASVTWNLVNLFSGKSQISLSKANEDVVELQRLALTAAIITQVHVATAAYKEAMSGYKLAQERNKIESEILRQVEATGPSQEGGKLEVIQAKLNAGVASLRNDLSYAELQTAFATVQQAIAVDQLPEKVATADIQSLAALLRAKEQKQTLLKLSTAITSNVVIPEISAQE